MNETMNKEVAVGIGGWNPFSRVRSFLGKLSNKLLDPQPSRSNLEVLKGC